MTYIPTYSRNDLAKSQGIPAASLKDYADMAIAQATLLFKLGTCRLTMPDNPIHAELVKNGILFMADSIMLAQGYRKAKANPFSSESIGSYSYSKVAAAVSKGKETGVMWFDLAVATVSECEVADNIPSHGGIELFEHDATFVQGLSDGNARFLSPKDIRDFRSFGYDPAPCYNDGGAPSTPTPTPDPTPEPQPDPELPEGYQYASSDDNWIPDPNNPGYEIERPR